MLYSRRHELLGAIPVGGHAYRCRVRVWPCSHGGSSGGGRGGGAGLVDTGGGGRGEVGAFSVGNSGLSRNSRDATSGAARSVRAAVSGPANSGSRSNSGTVRRRRAAAERAAFTEPPFTAESFTAGSADAADRRSQPLLTADSFTAVDLTFRLSRQPMRRPACYEDDP
jgi:hypothetical protein